jgi:carbon-monoxide dehydrogenase medium subunit/2-furoyl-CoA dehydrogenase FAD binding subunit
MKAAAFDYARPADLDEALALLAEHGSDGKLIAGGQSLVPMMAMRLVRPAMLIDINRLAELKQIQREGQSVFMGGGFRQRVLEDSPELDATLPLPRRALEWVGHVQTRNRGTVGGSLVHADPSAELPLAAQVLGARLHLATKTGERSLDATDFFLGPMVTNVSETECLIGIEWPVWEGTGIAAAFEETSIRHGDFAMAAAGCQLQLDANGICRRAAFGLGGVAGTPVAYPELAKQLAGQRLTPEVTKEIARTAADQSDPGSDLHASAEYRRHLAAVLLERVLNQAAAEARGGKKAH